MYFGFLVAFTTIIFVLRKKPAAYLAYGNSQQVTSRQAAKQVLLNLTLPVAVLPTGVGYAADDGYGCED
jgi:hypothetical protein